MLTVLAYIWAVFGACWIIFAPALSSSSEKRRLQPLRLAFLASTVAVLLWKARAIPAVWIMVLGLMWAGLGLYWVSPRKATGSGEYSMELESGKIDGSPQPAESFLSLLFAS